MCGIIIPLLCMSIFDSLVEFSKNLKLCGWVNFMVVVEKLIGFVGFYK